ncbi:ABC transporter substrate-binding protein [Pseudanabaena sp. PCC 6802]|uniref:ABC transporter substrate-binding protein n=1 Tax=Pseudanabaena sp. PCC 6802 TaxID=118173 RepID=UPI0003499ABA|nr:extracellular solute-binding protein [Pseudanabaena sp. PCC 6802]
MQRRQVIWGLGAVTLGLGSGGCSLFADPQRLRIVGLSGSIPSKIVEQFEKKFGKPVEFVAARTPPELWKALQEINKSQDANNIPDVMSLSDGWLNMAIDQSLIRPFSEQELAQIPQWQNLDVKWKNSVTRDRQILKKLAPSDLAEIVQSPQPLDRKWQSLLTREPQKVWAVPYRWGTTVIAYRTDKIPFEITSWADLWRPELRQKLSLPDDAREVIGIALKKLGKAYQTADLNAVQSLESELTALNAQTRFYSSDTYLQPLMIEDTWVAVGWSQDMRRALQQEPQIKVVVPKEGTALWADLWVLPKQKLLQETRPQNLDFVRQWIDFCLQPEIAAQITALTDGTTPITDLAKIPASVKANPLKFPQPEAIANSETLLPLSPETTAQYERLWRKIRWGLG